MQTEQQKTTYHFHSFSRVLLTIGIVVAINVLLAGVPLRLDLTAEKQFTLSATTKKTMQELKNPVTIKLFYSKEFPSYLLGLRQDTEDLLAEYRRLSKNNIIVEKYEFNPSTDTEIASQAESLGIQWFEVSNMGREKLEISRVYLGLAILFGEKKEVIPVIQSTDNMEYELTVAIKKMTLEKSLKIGVTTGHGESFSDQVRQNLSKQYQVDDVALAGLDRVPEDVATLIVAGPTQDFTEWEKFLIDQFIMRNGRLILLQDGLQINDQYLMGTANNLALNSILKSYGLKVNADAVIDPVANEFLAFGNGMTQLIRPYQAWPKVTGPGLNSDNPITAKLQTMTFPWPSSVTVLPAEFSGEETKIIELAKTTPKSFVLTDAQIMLFPDSLDKAKPTEQKSQLIALLVQGKIKSAYSNTQAPSKDAGQSDKNVKATTKPEVLTSTNEGAILVVGSSRFLNTTYIPQLQTNYVFLANALDALSQDPSLIEMRSRSITDRPIKQDLTDNQKQQIKFGNIAASAILSIIVGLFFYYKRARNNYSALKKYQYE